MNRHLNNEGQEYKQVMLREGQRRVNMVKELSIHVMNKEH
jgi:hypothetical protein